MTSSFAHSHYFGQRLKTTTGVALLCASTLLSCDNAVPHDADDTAAAESTLGTGSDVDLVRTLKALEVSPADSVVVADLGKTGTRAFKVLARYNDRSTADVTARATFSIDNPSVGTMTGPSFESAARATSQVDFATVTVRYREGATELTVQAKLTVAWMRTSGASIDILLTLPYLGGAVSATSTFNTNLQALDTFLAVDTTGSMGGEISAINASLGTAIVPGIRAVIANSNFGVGAVEDFPSGGYGSPLCGGSTADDQPFILLTPMTSDIPTVTTAFGKLLNAGIPRGCGNDTPEGQMEALYQIATGAGNVLSGVVNIASHTGKGRGGVEFRAGAMPAVSMITDAAFHTLGEPTRTCTAVATDYSGTVATVAHSRTVTTTALKNLCARFIGVSVETGGEAGCMGHADMRQMATDTGSLVQPEVWGPTGTRPSTCTTAQCCTGLAGAGEAPDASGMCPIIHKGTTDGLNIGAQVAAGITELVKYAPNSVSLVSSGGNTSVDGTITLPEGRLVSDFLQPVTALDGMAPTSPSGLKGPTASGDHFTGVVPGSTLRFTVPGKNDFLPATSKPQVFKAQIATIANGCATLDQHDVLIIVPAA